MKKITLVLLLFNIILYAEDTIININKPLLDRTFYYGIDYTISNSNLNSNLIGLEFGRISSISEEYDIFFSTLLKIKSESSFQNKGYVNKDFNEDGATTQKLLCFSLGLKFSKYFYIADRTSIFVGAGIDWGLSGSQSIFYDKSTREALKANSYTLYNLYPEIGFLVNFKRMKIEMYVNYINSLNKVKPFINVDNKYRMSMLGVGIRVLYI